MTSSERYRYIRQEVDHRLDMVHERKARDAIFAEGRIEGIAEGRVNGIAEGRVEGTRDIARAMLQNNFPDETILKLSHLSAAELQAIKNDTTGRGASI